MSGKMQMPMQTISTRFDADTLARLNEASQAQQRSRSEIIKEAVNGYLNNLVWFEAKVRQGLADIKAGRVVSHEEMKSKIRELGYSVD